MREETMAGVPVRVFTPALVRDEDVVLLNLHGGGFMIDAGSITENVDVAAQTGSRVVGVRYRLSPEHPFPAACDDALAVYRALLDRYRAHRIGLYGTSAGAALSAELVARLRHEGFPQPAALGFFSGTADLSRIGDTVSLFAGENSLRAVLKSYADGRDLEDPMLSPARGDLTGWPATLCITSSRDVLMSDTANFCRALTDAGASAQLLLFDGLPHAFWAYIDAPETDEVFGAMARFFVSRLQ